MPIDIVDVDEFTDPVTRPAGADPRSSAAWGEGHQKLANRTRYLKNRIDTVVSGVIEIPLDAGVFCTDPTDGSPRWVFDGSGTSNEWPRARPLVDEAKVFYSLSNRIPDGAVLTGVEVHVRAGAERAASGRWQCAITKRTLDLSGPPPYSQPTSAAIGSATDDGVSVGSGLVGGAIMTISGLSTTLDQSDGDYFIRIEAPTGVLATDVLLGVRAMFDAPRVATG